MKGFEPVKHNARTPNRQVKRRSSHGDRVPPLKDSEMVKDARGLELLFRRSEKQIVALSVCVRDELQSCENIVLPLKYGQLLPEIMRRSLCERLGKAIAMHDQSLSVLKRLQFLLDQKGIG